MRAASSCQGTTLEWCSATDRMTSSPSRRLAAPQVLATRLMASVALRVYTTSYGQRGAAGRLVVGAHGQQGAPATTTAVQRSCPSSQPGAAEQDCGGMAEPCTSILCCPACHDNWPMHELRLRCTPQQPPAAGTAPGRLTCGEAALMKRATFSRASSYSAVARADRACTPRCTFELYCSRAGAGQVERRKGMAAGACSRLGPWAAQLRCEMPGHKPALNTERPRLAG